LRRRSTTSDAEKYSQSEYFVSKQKEQHTMLQNILIVNILFSDILPIGTSMGYNNTQISGLRSRV
jgi:hypothetical protein